MADWEGLRRYIKGKYRIAEDNMSSLELVFDTSGGRSQRILVAQEQMGRADWAVIGTVVGEISDIDPSEALRKNASIIAGRLGLLDSGTLVFQYSLPLADVDPSELETAIDIVVNYGDFLEQEITGADRY